MRMLRLGLPLPCAAPPGQGRLSWAVTVGQFLSPGLGLPGTSASAGVCLPGAALQLPSRAPCAVSMLEKIGAKNMLFVIAVDILYIFMMRKY